VAAAPATPAASATISLADAGKWKIRSTDEAGGNVVEVELLAMADTSGWTLTGPNRKPIPVRVSAVAGDSIVTEAGPYESFLRKGVQVRTRSVNRLQNGKLVGTIEARFDEGQPRFGGSPPERGNARAVVGRTRSARIRTRV